MKTTIVHYLDSKYPKGIAKTVKTTTFFGIVVRKKTYEYLK